MTRLPTPEPGRGEAERWVAHHLGDLFDDAPVGSPRFRGGQSAADEALASFDVAGYAKQRNEVLPTEARGASGLSPWIRHGLLTLPKVWESVEGGPTRDVAKFRDELLWQEYARHLYARVGTRSSEALRYHGSSDAPPTPGWDREMACVGEMLEELEGDGWLVNQARMWLSSDWSIRHGARWQDGEDHFFRHLLDGSRAANRLGWQWVSGRATGRSYGFSRLQVERRAPELCSRCQLADRCPITDWPPDPTLTPVDAPLLRHDPEPTIAVGPPAPTTSGSPKAVWLTAESLGDEDPALVAHPTLPAVFVFDRPLLARLRLSAKRLVFLTESIADLSTRRSVRVHLGDPEAELDGLPVAVTHAPVPGFRRRSGRVDVAALYPWSWLIPPHGGSVASFSAWRKAAGR